MNTENTNTSTEAKPMLVDVIITSSADGVKINDLQVTYETKEIRKEIEDMLEVNNSFNLPKKYTYKIMPSSFWGSVAKIVMK